VLLATLELELPHLQWNAYGATATRACKTLREPPYRVVVDDNKTIIRWFNESRQAGRLVELMWMEPLSQLEQKMDAYEFFHQIVEPNCENALRPPYHLRLAWNAIVSLNTVPEFIVLHRLGYKTDVDRDLLYRETEEIRKISASYTA